MDDKYDIVTYMLLYLLSVCTEQVGNVGAEHFILSILSSVLELHLKKKNY